MALGRQRLLKRSGFLVAALALLIAAALLMLKPAPPRAATKVREFPRYLRPHEIERQSRRSTLETQVREVPADPTTSGLQPQSVLADPLHVALAEQEAALVIEAGALRDSPLGRMLLACLSKEQDGVLRELEQKTGLDLLQQVERIALAGSTPEAEPLLMLSGRFGGFDPSALDPDIELERRSDNVLLATSGDGAIARWKDELIVVGMAEEVRSAIARLEGERPSEPWNMAEEAYGEVYGTISGSLAGRLVPEAFRERLGSAAERVTLHVDATDDLLLVADVYGREPELVKELGTAIGGALALGRLSAVREENVLSSDLLDASRVIPDDGSFQLEIALPLATLQHQLGACANENDTPDRQ
jgi:hypothetical protein